MRYTRNVSENDNNEIWGQYTAVWLKGELSVLFGSGSNKNHKYSCNNRMKREMSVKHKADRTDIIAEKLKLWCTNDVKRVWWNIPEKATQNGTTAR